jgi:hypothetical protein
MNTPDIIHRKRLPETKLADLDALHEYAVRASEKKFAKYGKCDPLWFMRSPLGLTVVRTRWENETEKYMLVNVVRMMMGVIETQAYSFVSEAWAATGTADEPDLHGPVRDHPNREDVLFVQSFDKASAWRTTRYGVRYSDKRPGFGRLLARDDWNHDEMQHMSGHMADLLRPDPEWDKLVRQRQQELYEQFAGEGRAWTTHSDMTH